MARRSGWRITAVLALFVAALAPTAIDAFGFADLGSHAPVLTGSAISVAPAAAVRPGDPSMHRRVSGPSSSRMLLAVLIAILGVVGLQARGVHRQAEERLLLSRHRTGSSGLRGPPLLTT